MAKNIISRIAGGVADNIPLVNIATSAQRAARRIGKGTGSNVAGQDVNAFAEEEALRAADNRDRNVALAAAKTTVKTTARIAALVTGTFSLPILLIIFVVCISCFGATIALMSAFGYGSANNSNMQSFLNAADKKNCRPSAGYTRAEFIECMCKDEEYKVVDPNTGQEITVRGPEDCEEKAREGDAVTLPSSASSSSQSSTVSTGSNTSSSQTSAESN